VLGDLCGKSLLVIGAGRIAEATAKHLAHRGAAPITVANRTLERAEEVAQRLGGRADTIARLPALLAAADLVITCTSAPHFILEADAVERAVAGRQGRPLVIIDVSVPRDVEPLAGSVAGVRLFNLDDFEPVVAENAKAREGEVNAVRGIIAEEVQSFHEWLARAEVTPLIQSLRRRGENVRRQCVEEARRKLSHLPAEDMEAVERLADLLVKRLLHAPTKALRAHPNGDPFTLAGAVQELFDLTDSDAPEVASSGDACRGVAGTYAAARDGEASSPSSVSQHSVAGGRDHVHVESSHQ
jgi:glutamyl-tRNA reductase